MRERPNEGVRRKAFAAPAHPAYQPHVLCHHELLSSHCSFVFWSDYHKYHPALSFSKLHAEKDMLPQQAEYLDRPRKHLEENVKENASTNPLQTFRFFTCSSALRKTSCRKCLLELLRKRCPTRRRLQKTPGVQKLPARNERPTRCAAAPLGRQNAKYRQATRPLPSPKLLHVVLAKPIPKYI